MKNDKKKKTKSKITIHNYAILKRESTANIPDWTRLRCIECWEKEICRRNMPHTQHTTHISSLILADHSFISVFVFFCCFNCSQGKIALHAFCRWLQACTLYAAATHICNVECFGMRVWWWLGAEIVAKPIYILIVTKSNLKMICKWNIAEDWQDWKVIVEPTSTLQPSWHGWNKNANQNNNKNRTNVWHNLFSNRMWMIEERESQRNTCKM